VRWLKWFTGSNEEPQVDDIDVNAEIAAAKIKAAEVRRSRREAERRTEEYRRDVDRLVKLGSDNHFGESITLGMMRR